MSGQTRKPQTSKVLNGYVLYWTSEMKNRVPLPGESADNCRKRTMAECQRHWKEQTPEAASLRSQFTSRAKEINRETAAAKRQAMCQSSSHPTTALTTPAPAPSLFDGRAKPLLSNGDSGMGFCFGLGDSEFGLQKAMVRTADEPGQGFVKSMSAAWRHHAGGACKENEELRNANTTVRLSCMEELGFCRNSVQSMSRFGSTLEQLKGFVRSHRRLHLGKGRSHNQSQGPNVSISHPLLVARRTDSTDCTDPDPRSSQPLPQLCCLSRCPTLTCGPVANLFILGRVRVVIGDSHGLRLSGIQVSGVASSTGGWLH